MKTWFQNRRTKWKRQTNSRLDEYRHKTQSDGKLIIDKERLSVETGENIFTDCNPVSGLFNANYSLLNVNHHPSITSLANSHIRLSPSFPSMTTNGSSHHHHHHNLFRGVYIARDHP